jgi:hypothetical protein
MAIVIKKGASEVLALAFRASAKISESPQGILNATRITNYPLFECANCFSAMASTQNSQGDLTSEILQALSQHDGILSSEAFPSQKSADVKSALDRLGSRSMINYETIDREEAVLEPEAEEIAANGSHEARVFEALRQAVDGLTVSELEAAVGDRNVVKVGQGKAFKSKWIKKGDGGKLVASVSFKGRYKS